MKQNQAAVFPVYGWGWNKGPNRFEVPTPFTIDISGVHSEDGEHETISGIVSQPSTHELIGHLTVLSKRTTTDKETHYIVLLNQNASLETPDLIADENTITGYAKVVVDPVG